LADGRAHHHPVAADRDAHLDRLRLRRLGIDEISSREASATLWSSSTTTPAAWYELHRDATPPLWAASASALARSVARPLPW
jgi:hypothetical protein